MDNAGVSLKLSLFVADIPYGKLGFLILYPIFTNKP